MFSVILQEVEVTENRPAIRVEGNQNQFKTRQPNPPSSSCLEILSEGCLTNYLLIIKSSILYNMLKFYACITGICQIKFLFYGKPKTDFDLKRREDMVKQN